MKDKLARLWRWLHKKTHLALAALLALLALALLVYGLLVFLSYRAADIFNIVLESRQLFPGQVTVERLSATPWGRVSFENLIWKAEDGRLLAEIPEGSFRVNPLDVLTQSISSRSLKELQAERAYLHLILDEHMELTEIYRKESPEARRDKKPDGHKLTGPDSDRPFICKLDIRQATIEAEAPGSKPESPRRHFTIGHTDLRAEVNTRGKTSIKLAAGQFTGTVEAQSIQLNGTLDFAPATPVYDLHISLRGCNPNSLDVGMKLDDLADATAHITGQLPRPVLDGVLMFPKLHMPGLEFTDVKGTLHYEDGLFTAQDVTADAYDGKVKAKGYFNIDEKAWGLDLTGEDIKGGRAVHDKNLHCRVTLELHMEESRLRKTKTTSGKFLSGPGTYYLVPFEKLSGTFEQQGKGALIFRDAVISLAAGDVTTAEFSLDKGKLTLAPIYLETRRGQRRLR